MSTVEEDFNSTVEKINAKLQKAAKALKEANDLRESIGIPGFIAGSRITEDLSKEEDEQFWQDLQLFDVSDLRREIDNAGWSTSSSRC